jgi:hypothetical protein
VAAASSSVEQRRDEGVDAAAEILKIEQEHIGRVHHRRRGAAHFAIEAEHGMP